MGGVDQIDEGFHTRGAQVAGGVDEHGNFQSRNNTYLSQRKNREGEKPLSK